MNHDHHDDTDLFRGHRTATAPEPVLFCFWQHNRAVARRQYASVPATSIREIVVIVVDPRYVFDLLIRQVPL